MNISLNWLKEHVEGLENIDPAELGLKLTMSTVEVDSMKNLASTLDKVVVGQIVSLRKHPNADKLVLVEINIGDRRVNVVCGGSNLRENMLVALALPGAKVRWHGEGDLVTLAPAKVRGEDSEGMICASSELGLAGLYPSTKENEIIDLSDSGFTIGDPLAEAMGFDDVIFEIDNKSLTNRPDLWGHYGMAREVAALYGLKLKPYQLAKIKPAKQFNLKVKVEDSKLCPRYMGIALRGIKIVESPVWLKKRLESIGQRPINNIVDITNFVMNELGQPLHAFSADKIKDDEIIVRRAGDGEKIITLDGEKRVLAEDDLVIADSDKAIALAGVMGNLNSHIDDKTNTVILESANFDATTIRKTSSRLGLRTEAAIRFEKSLDPNLCETALKKAVALILEIIPTAEIVSPLVDAKDFELFQGPIELNWDFVNKKIGQAIGQQQIIKILSNLGFEVSEKKSGLLIKIPSWRATKDISIKEDLIEEITRIFGYDELDPIMPSAIVEYTAENSLRRLERDMKNVLALSLGANEVYNYSFVSKKLLESFGQAINNLELENPWDQDLCYLRKSLIPNLLQNAVDNSRFYNQFSLFETGKVFINDKSGEPVKQDAKVNLPTQDLMAAGVIVSDRTDNFLDCKGIIETLFNKMKIEVDYDGAVPAFAWCHPKECLTISIGKEVVGYVSAIHPAIARKLDLRGQAAIWEINLTKLVDHAYQIEKFKILPKFPAIELDISITVEQNVPWKNIQGIVDSAEPKIIRRVELLDVFKNDKIKAGNKSLTFRITYRADDRTLEMADVNKLQEKIINQLKKGVGAEIRQ